MMSPTALPRAFFSSLWARRIPVAILLATTSFACASKKVGSIGAVLSRNTETGAVHVREAPPGLTGQQAGLAPGDRIKMVNGRLLDDLDGAAIKKLLRGPVDSQVTLTVIRGEQVLQLEVIRRPRGEAPQLRPREERIE